MSSDAKSVPQEIQNAQELLKTVKQEINKIIVGQSHLIDCLLIGVMSDGHLLLEGVPGIAKNTSR